MVMDRYDKQINEDVGGFFRSMLKPSRNNEDDEATCTTEKPRTKKVLFKEDPSLEDIKPFFLDSPPNAITEAMDTRLSPESAFASLSPIVVALQPLPDVYSRPLFDDIYDVVSPIGLSRYDTNRRYRQPMKFKELPKLAPPRGVLSSALPPKRTAQPHVEKSRSRPMQVESQPENLHKTLTASAQKQFKIQLEHGKNPFAATYGPAFPTGPALPSTPVFDPNWQREEEQRQQKTEKKKKKRKTEQADFLQQTLPRPVDPPRLACSACSDKMRVASQSRTRRVLYVLCDTCQWRLYPDLFTVSPAAARSAEAAASIESEDKSGQTSSPSSYASSIDENEPQEDVIQETAKWSYGWIIAQPAMWWLRCWIITQAKRLCSLVVALLMTEASRQPYEQHQPPVSPLAASMNAPGGSAPDAEAEENSADAETEGNNTKKASDHPTASPGRTLDGVHKRRVTTLYGPNDPRIFFGHY